jgi:hypothetical protein
MKLAYCGLVLLLTLPAASATQGQAAPSIQQPSVRTVETYESATIDANGSLRITTSDHREIMLQTDGELPIYGRQTAFTTPVVSGVRKAVGSQAEYGNGGTSYDIPRELVVYSQGTVHRFRGSGLPILLWSFADAGTRVAYGQVPVHFGCSTHYELRDIQSERLMNLADIPESCGQNPDPPKVAVPQWVTDLINTVHDRASAAR